MNYDVLVVGGGIAGLTSAAYLCKDGYRVLLCEKEKKVGGLVNSFNFNGFTFDGGIRAVENSGILFPMLRQLGLEVDFIRNNISIGIEDETVKLVSEDSLFDYQALLNKQFPDNTEDIGKIIDEIKRVMKYMDILYGIDNPLFLDLKNDKEYLFKTILPWLFKYITTVKKISKLNTPIYDYLQKYTKNSTLIDMIAQHFFKETPAFFALSYFSLYLDYKYPRGGTGAVTEKMEKFILDNKGEIKKETEICHIDHQKKQVQDLRGNIFYYKKLIWAADLKTLYNILDVNSLSDARVKEKVQAFKKGLSGKVGGDSVLTVYLAINMDKEYFENIFSGHFFYTPVKKGLSNLNPGDLSNKSTGRADKSFTADKEIIFNWLRKYYELTTYEISCPVIHDVNLAPEGKTGLIVSTLIDYCLVKYIYDMGWYDEFKKISSQCIINILEDTIFPEIKTRILDQFTSTPLTLEKLTGNLQGAITGWAFTNDSIPAVNSLPKVASSILTPVPDIFQAGQWTFSPSGFPISILTGKLAADKARKQLKR